MTGRDVQPGWKLISDLFDTATFEYCMGMTPAGTSLPQEEAVSRFLRRVATLLSLKYTLAFTTIWAFLLGVTVVSVRAATGRQQLKLVWLLAALVPGAIVGVFLALKRLPSRTAVRALLDNRSRCGGLLMAAERVDLGEWESRIPELNEPRLHWRSRRAVALVLSSALFVSVSFFIPIPSGAESPRPLDIDKEVHEIAADIDLLKNEEIIDKTQAESLDAKLDAISNEAQGEDPAKTWEALDHLQDTVTKTAQEAAQEMARNNEKLGEAQALSEALAEGGSSMDSKLVTEAMKELQKQMEAAGSKDGGPSIPGDLAEGLKSGSLSKEQLKQLSEALKQNKGKISKQLGKLRAGKMIDLKTLKQCENAGKCDSAGLAEFLKENEGEMTVSEMIDGWGRGGVDRGRGDAPMTWADPSSEKGAKFKEQILPSSMSNLSDSELVGRSTGAPEIEKGAAQKTGALRGAGAGGGSAFTQTVLPRHRGAVNRYFERH